MLQGFIQYCQKLKIIQHTANTGSQRSFKAMPYSTIQHCWELQVIQHTTNTSSRRSFKSMIQDAIQHSWKLEIIQHTANTSLRRSFKAMLYSALQHCSKLDIIQHPDNISSWGSFKSMLYCAIQHSWELNFSPALRSNSITKGHVLSFARCRADRPIGLVVNQHQCTRTGLHTISRSLPGARATSNGGPGHQVLHDTDVGNFQSFAIRLYSF